MSTKQKKPTPGNPRNPRARMTSKQRRFVELLPACNWNAAEAARRAGYSELAARETGYENLTKPHIAAAVEEMRERLSKQSGITAERVLAEIGRVAFANMLDYVTPQPDGTVAIDLAGLTREQAAAIASVEVGEVKNAGMDGDEVAESLEKDKPLPPNATERTVKFRLHDKLAALHKLGLHLGLFKAKEGDDAPEVAAKGVDVSAMDPDEREQLANLLLKLKE